MCASDTGQTRDWAHTSIMATMPSRRAGLPLPPEHVPCHHDPCNRGRGRHCHAQFESRSQTRHALVSAPHSESVHWPRWRDASAQFKKLILLPQVPFRGRFVVPYSVSRSSQKSRANTVIPVSRRMGSSKYSQVCHRAHRDVYKRVCLVL